MKRVVITADSAADLPKDIADKYGIEIMPMNVIIDGEEKKDSVNITASQIFDYADNTGIIPKTSAVPPAEYTDFFEKFTKDGKAVVHLSFCSELSSTCRNAKMSASNYDDVYVIDTHNLAGGIGLLAIKGSEMRDKGLGAKEICEKLSELVPYTKVSYLLDNIDFLRRSGRCSAAKAFGVSLFSVKPCAAMVNGKIEVVKKYMGKSKGLDSFIIPGTSLASAHLHIARTICRRAERIIISLNKMENINPLLIKYINRLSDTLYAIARYSEEKLIPMKF